MHNTMKHSHFLELLLPLQDPGYKFFHQKLIPNIDPDRILGIRTPMLRKLSASLFSNRHEDVLEYLQQVPHYYYEENNLHAFFIERIRDYHECMKQTEDFLPYIDNWACCDSFSPKVFKKHPQEVIAKVLCWLQSPHEYTVRYGIGVLLSNYLDTEFRPEFLDLVANIRFDAYYVKMMQAWYFSFALIKHFEESISIFTTGRLDRFTHNKALQKAIESYRIAEERKNYLKTLKQR